MLTSTLGDWHRLTQQDLVTLNMRLKSAGELPIVPLLWFPLTTAKFQD
jgi:hypothetical protein